jgi:hypothetical protein
MEGDLVCNTSIISKTLTGANNFQIVRKEKVKPTFTWSQFESGIRQQLVH